MSENVCCVFGARPPNMENKKYIINMKTKIIEKFIIIISHTYAQEKIQVPLEPHHQSSLLLVEQYIECDLTPKIVAVVSTLQFQFDKD